jgi:multiple sugar transport system substrate-binding protein
MRSPTPFTRVAGGAVAAIALAVAIAGCSPTAPSSPGGDEKADLSLMIWDPAQTAGVQKAVDGFEAEYPNINVEVQQVPQDQYYTKLDASLGAGEGPDVMWQSSLAIQYAEGGALEPLDSYIKDAGLDLADYPDAITGLYNFDGKQYGIPKDQDTWTFVYNTAVFDQLGITDVPTNDWTWDDMVKIAQEVKDAQTADTDIPIAVNYTFNNGVASLIHSLGGTVIDGDEATVASPEGVEALGMIKDLQDQGLIYPIADSADFNPVTALISGTVAIAEIPSWNLSLLSQASVDDGTFQVVRPPSVNGKWATDTNGLSYVMNANSQQKDAAWLLIQFLTSTMGAELHAEGGAAIPANVDPAALDAFVSTNSELVGLSEALSLSQEQAYLRTSTEFPLVRPTNPEIESTVMGPYWSGSITATQATEGIDAILNKALAG